MTKPTIEHLYIHIPFCAKVCPYCSFYVHGGGVSKQERFVEALVREIGQSKVDWDLKSIFIGGGTPSMLSAPLFDRVASALPSLKKGVEFTLEVNPATVTERKMASWGEAGVNRVSLGAQSFRDDELKMLGRQHTGAEVGETVRQLREKGFTNINIDLIFGLPGQTKEHWRENLERACDLDPNHLSAYQLTYEEDTPFFEKVQKGMICPDESSRAEMFEMTEGFLCEKGLNRYEISNFSRAGYESIHNQAYWLGKDYLGFGPSAVSTVSSERWTNRPDTEGYIEKLLSSSTPEREWEEMTEEIYWRERVMLGLRTREGVSTGHFKKKPETIAVLNGLQSNGLLSQVNDQWVLTPEGRLLADSVAGAFF